MHDNCKSQQNTKAKAWACSDSKGAVAVESAWIPEYVHVNMYCFDCFYFVFERPKPRRNHPLKWNAHSCTCTRIKTSSVLFSRIVWVSEKFAIVFIGIRSSGKDLDELYLCLRFFYWGMWWYLVAHGLLWRGEVLICLTCAISVSWPMLKDFSTRVRGFFFRVVMADSAEDA